MSISDSDYCDRPEGHNLKCSHCDRFDTWHKPQGDDEVICWDCAKMHAVECYCGCWPLRRDYDAVEESCPDCRKAADDEKAEGVSRAAYLAEQDDLLFWQRR